MFQFFSVVSEKPWYSKAYKKGVWDGVHRFYSKKNHAFPSGLLPILNKKFPNSYEIIPSTNSEQKICLDNISNLKTITPRDDQLKSTLDALKEKRGIIQAPTGSGKSICIAMLCACVEGNILILVHTKNLLHQTAEVLESQLGEKIGKIGDGLFDEQRITMAIIASLKNVEQDKLLTHSMLILDEAHHASATTFYKTILNSQAPLRFGLSADTFDIHKLKSDRNLKNYKIMGCFGPIVSNISNKEMKEKEVLAIQRIKFLKMKDPYTEDYTKKSYLDAYCAYHCMNKALYLKIHKICEDFKHLQILILVKHIHHGKKMEKLLKGRGIDTTFVCGEHPTEHIEEGIAKFKKKKINVIIASTIFNEGTNIPEIDMLVNAAGDMSPTKQRLGRALRRREDKDSVLIYDFYLDGNKHIEHHAKTRIKIYKAEGHEVL